MYMLFGLIYGVYVTGWGGGKWYLFPINVLGGPIVFFVVVFRVLAGKRIYY